ncbi:MAG: sulfite exporter TauE/SafE family protein [Anderseniella sp.]|nr:sulfite exporter TauE/SafE family protein [Anderseniella sp.]
MIDVFGHSIELDYRIGVVIACVCLGGFIRGFTGFGSALAIIPSLAMIFSPREAVAMHAVMEVPVILSMAVTAARGAKRSVIAPMLAGLVVATPAGALVLAVTRPDVMKIAISLVVLGMVVLLYIRGDLKLNLSGPGAAVAGVIGGIFQGATGVGGPPVVTALLARGDASAQTRANIFTVMSAMIVMSILSFWWLGLFTPTVLVFGATAAPFCVGATWAGARWFGRGGDTHFQKAVLGLLVVLSLITLATTLS